MALASGVCCAVLALALGTAVAVPNGSFEQGGERPAGWRLTGEGAWEAGADGRVVTVVGTGSDSSQWRTEGRVLAPDTLYRMTFRADASDASGGCIVSGASFCNRDFPVQPGWRRHSFVFATPARLPDVGVRVGQWHARGRIRFDDVALSVVLPVHRQSGQVVLGDGERLDGDRYSFQAPLAGASANYARPLHRFDADFNSNRWVFGSGDEVVYRFAIPGARQTAAAVTLNVNYRTRGGGVVEASRRGKVWTELARFDGTGHVSADVPAALLPAESLQVRIRGAGVLPGWTYFQVNDLRYAATLDRKVAQARGRTVFLETESPDDTLEVQPVALRRDRLSGRALVLSLRSTAGAERIVQARLVVSPEVGDPVATAAEVTLAAGAGGTLALPLAAVRTGMNALSVELTEADRVLWRARAAMELPALEDVGYGRALPGGGPVALWWCEGTHKVARDCPVPATPGAAVELEAARNEYEPAQVVLRPERDLTNVRVAVSDLVAPGARLPAAQVSVSQVAYVEVVRPTDEAGSAGWWPDPLPPFPQGCDLGAGLNHPLWITVHVPPDQPAGTYEGTLRLSADGWQAAVPLRLKVWDFALPRESSLRTAFGLSAGRIRQYHGLEGRDELRGVLDLYFRDFAAHRIAPYDPAPLDPIRVDFPTGRAGNPEDLVARMDFAAFDRQCEKNLDGLGFNTFRVKLQGMPGGTFHARRRGRAGSFEQGTAEYEALMADQGRQLVAHLREKGWLEKAYCYWFDEPQPRDYPFVAEGMALLKRAAPGLTRMLTEQPEQALIGSVDLWCPVVGAVGPQAIRAARARGERVWWYLCTSPKAPHIGLFIDRPATDLRVWPWLSRKWGVEGLLVWSANYWTSEAAFPPPALQNPWEDPMSYVSGYGRKPGQVGYWGNGDGRFLYPPRRAGSAGGPKYLGGPVDSIRWEMLREGIEDYEYFVLLDELIGRAQSEGRAAGLLAEARALAAVPDEVIADDSTYAKSPGPLYAHRRRMAEMIERLTQALR